VPRHDGPGAWAGAEADGDLVRSDAHPDTTSRRPTLIARTSEAEALSDGVWFVQHSDRSFRIRQSADGGVWIVRPAGDALLRVLIPDAVSVPPHDSDAELGPLWFAAALAPPISQKGTAAGAPSDAPGQRRRP
jgi:hypothetical protein